MTKDELKEWATEVFWPAYKDLCRTPFPTKWTGGARGEAVTKIQQMDPSEELRKRILHAIAAQREHRSKLYEQCGSAKAYEERTKYVKLYSNRDGRTWLHNSGWDDEIPSLTELRQEEEKRPKNEDLCQCGEKAFNRHQCARCYTKMANPGFADEIKQNLRKMGFTKSKDENWREASMRCLKANALKLPRFERD